MKKLSFGTLIENKKFAVVFSLIVAVIAWFIVVIQFDNQASGYVNNIAVDTTTNSTLEDLGLEVIRVEPENVTVIVQGTRNEISTLGNKQLTVTLSATDIANITKAGTYPIRVEAQKKVTNDSYQITGVSPETVSVTFDKKTSTTLTLEAEAPNITVEDGYIRESLVADPESITIRGAETEINDIERAVLTTDRSETITNTTSGIEAELILYNSAGEVLNNENYEFSRDSYSITVLVYKQKEVDLIFKYRNVPDNLDKNNLEYSMSIDKVTVAGPADTVDNLKEINLGYIDISEINIGKTFKFDINVPSGFKNLSDETEVEITFEDSGWSINNSLTINDSDIDFLNYPDDYDVELQSSGIKSISVVGSSEVVSGITSSDLTATIDFSSRTLAEGTQTIPVTIQVYNKDNVWIVGSYECTITVTKK